MKIPKIKIGQKPTYQKIGEVEHYFELFQALEREHENCYIFESLGEEGKFSRYTVFSCDPQSIISGTKKELIIDGVSFPTKNPYFALRQMMPEKTIARNYAGGLVGYLSYEATQYFEPALSLKTHPDWPLFMFGVYTDGVVYDKLTGELFYYFYEKDRSEMYKKHLGEHISRGKVKVSCNGDSITKEEHHAIVERVKEHIRSGNTFQCEVGMKTKYEVEGDALCIYEKLREVNPSPFMYYVKFGGRKIIGASPELLFSLRDGEMTTRPLAGTVKRGTTEKEDQDLARELLSDEKERAEHMMLVDMHRNDMGRVSQFGTVRIRDLMTIKKFSHVQHMASEIVGILTKNEDMFSGLAANFPMGTICGTPKVETMRIIDTNEPEARGPYGGGVGHFGFNGDCTFALALRSLYMTGKNAYAQTSGGIVADSEPEKEYQEIQNKLAAMKKVLSSFTI